MALLGGETAEMPGVYVEGELDIVGTVVGVVDRAELITGERLEAGDVVIALPSSGLHTNGYSLARAALDDLDWQAPDAELGGSLQDALLAAHRCYLAAYQALAAAGLDVRAMSHITGGGLIDNPPRVLPGELNLRFDLGTYTLPPLFERIVQRLGVRGREAYQALNMGVGFLFMLPPAQVTRALDVLRGAGESPWVIGEVVVEADQAAGANQERVELLNLPAVLMAPGPGRSASVTTLPKPPTGLSLPERHASAELWVVRHGESTWNADGRYQGQTDVPLSVVGVLQASSLAERLTSQRFAAVYSSDLVRAQRTAEIVTERLSGEPQVQTVPGLREIDVGQLSGAGAAGDPQPLRRVPDGAAGRSLDDPAARRREHGRSVRPRVGHAERSGGPAPGRAGDGLHARRGGAGGRRTGARRRARQCLGQVVGGQHQHHPVAALGSGRHAAGLQRRRPPRGPGSGGRGRRSGAGSHAVMDVQIRTKKRPASCTGRFFRPNADRGQTGPMFSPVCPEII